MSLQRNLFLSSVKEPPRRMHVHLGYGHYYPCRVLRSLLHLDLVLSSTEEVLANRQGGDLSLLMFSILTTGVGAWVLYGVLKHDVVIVIANAVSFCCLSGILWFKLREKLDPA